MKKNIIYLSLIFSNVLSEKDTSIIDSVLNICSDSDKKTTQKKGDLSVIPEKKSSSGISKATSEKVSDPIDLESSICKTPHKDSSQETQKITPVDSKNTEVTTLSFVDNIISTKKTDDKKEITSPKLIHKKKTTSSYNNSYNIEKNGFNRYNVNRKFVRKENNKKKETMTTLKKLKNNCAKRNNQGPARVSHRVYNY
jgi:hypothetical protein